MAKKDVVPPSADHEDGHVPTDLLDLHVQLEEAGMTPQEFKEVYGEPEAGKQS